MAYYPTGLIHIITDAQQNVTTYEYDLRGNRTAVVDAAAEPDNVCVRRRQPAAQASPIRIQLPSALPTTRAAAAHR